MSLGKGVYVEKPLAQTFREAELMIAAEAKYKVAAQMGNQGHSGNNPLQFEAWVKAGIIKNVRKVTAFMNGRRRWHGMPACEITWNDGTKNLPPRKGWEAFYKL